MNKALFAVLLCLPSLAFAHGDWGSSGSGEFIRDQFNPWFLKSVTEVRYCLEIDPAGFSASPAKVEELSAKAIEYWKSELGPRAMELGVGGQKFTLTNPGLAKKCNGDEDLTLQFGYGTLNPDELKYFSDSGEDPLDYVGIALRNSYDKETLHGKGVVFIASDMGANPYNHGQGVDQGLWSYDGLLFRILQHELGHVFGIQHTDEGFMAADFPENMVRNYRPYFTLPSAPFFEPGSSFDTCPQPESGCAHVETSDHWASFRLSTYDILHALKPVDVGTVTDAVRSASRLIFPLRVFLPKEQKVFLSVPPGTLTIKGPARQEFNVSGTMQTVTGEKKPVLLELRPERGEAYFDDGKGFQRH